MASLTLTLGISVPVSKPEVIWSVPSLGLLLGDGLPLSVFFFRAKLEFIKIFKYRCKYQILDRKGQRLRKGYKTYPRMVVGLSRDLI